MKSKLLPFAYIFGNIITSFTCATQKHHETISNVKTTELHATAQLCETELGHSFIDGNLTEHKNDWLYCLAAQHILGGSIKIHYNMPKGLTGIFCSEQEEICYASQKKALLTNYHAPHLSLLIIDQQKTGQLSTCSSYKKINNPSNRHFLNIPRKIQPLALGSKNSVFVEKLPWTAPCLLILDTQHFTMKKSLSLKEVPAFIAFNKEGTKLIYPQQQSLYLWNIEPRYYQKQQDIQHILRLKDGVEWGAMTWHDDDKRSLLALDIRHRDDGRLSQFFIFNVHKKITTRVCTNAQIVCQKFTEDGKKLLYGTPKNIYIFDPIHERHIACLAGLQGVARCLDIKESTDHQKIVALITKTGCGRNAELTTWLINTTRKRNGFKSKMLREQIKQKFTDLVIE